MSTGTYQSAGLRRRKLARKVKWYVGASIGLALVILAIYVVGFSGVFTIQKFEVIGVPAEQTERILEVLRPQVMAGRIGGLLGPDNYFSWNDSLVYTDVRSNRVSIDKKLFSRQVSIIVHPRQRYGVWCQLLPDTTSACNWVDAAGVAFESAPMPDGQLITTLVEPASTTTIVLGAPVIKQEYFETIKRVTESLPVLRLPVSAIVVDRALEEVQLLTVSGTKVAFSLRFDPTISALPALKKLIESPGITGMRTIDFTVENRVFYTVK